ncbi:MAG: trypsin-like peptidase domain-containing protein [Cystobacter sp.]
MFKRYLGLAAVGFLTACGAQQDFDESLSSDALMSNESTVIVGEVDWKSTTLLTGTQATRANAVAYLAIPAAGSRCTAWLVSDDVIITNNHCISTAAGAAGAKATFNYIDGVAAGSRIAYDCSTFIKTWSNLDMTALRCAALNGKKPGQVYGKLTVASTNAATNAGVYVLHQNCNTSGCAPTKKFSPGKILNANYSSTDASYDSDTLGGSSGSPVLSTATNEVIALHHYGYSSGGKGTHNSGVRATLLKSALAEIGL